MGLRPNSCAQEPNPNQNLILKNFARSSMEVVSSSSSEVPPSNWDYLNLLVLRPALAIAFVLFLIFLSWLLAWKLVLVDVPLVQEIFGLRKKNAKPKPPTRRLSKIYNTLDARNSAS